MNLSLLAIKQLKRKGPEQWESTGNQPQFSIEIPLGGLRAAWHVVDLSIASNQVDALAPTLYPDYGKGMFDHARIPLKVTPDVPSNTGQVICFMEEVRALGFTPAVAPGVFELRHLRIKPISRVHAAWRMLHALIFREGSRVKLAWRALAELMRGSDRFAVWLYATYRNGGGQQADSIEPMHDYPHWLRLYDLPARPRQALSEITQESSLLISIVMPVYNTPARWLKRCIESVLEQSYSHWQLCIADDASTLPHVRQILEHYAHRDPRIHVMYRTTNGHISDASNSAFELAQGEYVALLDHDDELHPSALAEIASAIDLNPDWKLIYSDEDKIDEDGQRYGPYFKPDWNYDLLLSQNVFSHLGVYKTSLMREVGGFRKGYEGSQDHDLVLRCLEKINPSRELGHVPRVLYHWRAIAGSAALAIGEKSYAIDAGVRAIRDHLGRLGRDATVAATDGNHYRVRYALPRCPPNISLIIPTRDKAKLLRKCITSILELTSYPNYEILVIDNQSRESATLAYFKELSSEPRVRIIPYDAPFNYSAINNYGVSLASGSVIGLINNDTEVISAGWLEEMVSHAMRPEVGAVGAMLYYPTGAIQHAGVLLGIHGVASHAYAHKPRGHVGQCARALLVQSMSAVTGACLLIRKEIFEQVSGFDDRLQVAFNDVDFCLRVRQAGYSNIWTPFAELYHHESASRGSHDTAEKQLQFDQEVKFMVARWGNELAADPAYNRNLSLTGEPFSLAFPPRNMSRTLDGWRSN